MFEFKSFGKINLGLEVMARRGDGYHELRTIFQTIDFFDLIKIKENLVGRLRLSGNNTVIDWGAGNTIAQAFRFIYENFDLYRGFDVRVEKRIPPGSGLGGGSSNAAVMLMFLKDYFDLKISPEEMIEAGKTIGADVPFFFLGGTVLGEGIGEKMSRMDDREEDPVAIVIPAVSVSTRLIFSRFGLTNKPFESKIELFLKSGDKKVLENNLESITFQLFPEIKRIKEKMQIYGSDLVMMSGSGSSIFCILESSSGERIRKDFPGVILTRTIDSRYYKNNIGAWPSGKASVFGADIRRFESSRPRG